MTESSEEYENLILPNQFRIIYQNIDNDISVVNLDKFKNPQIQFFPFPNTITNYLLLTFTSNVYHKLICTCKYFYSKCRITVISSVMLRNSFKDNQKALVGYDSPILPKLCSEQLLTKIWITKLFEIGRDVDSNCLSNFCQKIYKCEACVVDIIDKNLTEKEFHFLVQQEFIRELHLCDTAIKKTDDSFLQLEDIIGRVPKANALWISPIYFTLNTFSNLLKLPPAKNKLEYFVAKFNDMIVPGFHSNFNYELFMKYLTKIVAPKARFDIIFVTESEITGEMANVYQQKTEEYLSLWIEEKPEIYFGTSLS